LSQVIPKSSNALRAGSPKWGLRSSQIHILKAGTIGWVLNSTKITRILLSESGARSKGEEGIIASRLAAPDVGTRIEVRVSPAQEFHDRAIVADKGDVLLLGTSLNGVGKHLSTLVRPDRECWPVYRKRIDGLWNAARVIAPQPIIAASTAAASANPVIGKP
jgi:hypothetical protein